MARPRPHAYPSPHSRYEAADAAILWVSALAQERVVSLNAVRPSSYVPSPRHCIGFPFQLTRSLYSRTHQWVSRQSCSNGHVQTETVVARA